MCSDCPGSAGQGAGVSGENSLIFLVCSAHSSPGSWVKGIPLGRGIISSVHLQEAPSSLPLIKSARGWL